MEFKPSENMADSFFLTLWGKWNLRAFLILSLSLQIFLILFAPLRKKTVKSLIVLLVWLAYLVADSVVSFGIGLIAHNSDLCVCEVEVDKAIQAFWVSFLMLHLGGPDTITAFSLEDNLLWKRHLVTVIFQGLVAIYVFVHIFPKNQSLAIPTVLVFLAAILKNVERLMALYLSNLPKLKQSMLSQKDLNRANLELVDELEAPEDGHSTDEEPKLDESIVVKHAHHFFQIFKVFIVDLIFSRQARDMSRQYFQKVSAMDALRVISVELQFIYDVLHTKVLVIHSMLSYFFRFIAFTNIVLAFVLFNRLKRDEIHALDVRITYSLLLGGIALDVISLFMLIFSDWTVAEFKLYNRGSSQQDSFLNSLVSAMDHMRKPQFAPCGKPNAIAPYVALNTPFIFRRWSESISACNIFSEFLKESPRKLHKHNRSSSILGFCNVCCFPIHIAMKIVSCCQHAGGGRRAGGGGRGGYFKIDRGLMITEMKYVSKNPFINKLWIFIFDEVRRKSRDANDLIKVREIFDARGGMFLESIAEEIDCGNLLAYVTEANYDSSVLAWHIATEISYNMKEQNMGSIARIEEREFSKILSDYMVYLLLNQPNVVSIVGGVAQMTAADMLSEMWINNDGRTTNLERLCRELTTSGTTNLTSPLGEGIKLAREMERLGENKWKVMGGVWVEMLSYAAIHIKGNAHVLVLSKGGELLAFIWLLMVHFGCFYKPEWGISRVRFHIYQP